MKKIGIFYGSSTGYTENIANIIHDHYGDAAKIYDVVHAKKEDIENHEICILGVSSWQSAIGMLQYDWAQSFLSIIKTADLSKKTIALFGLGDQFGYPESFANALGFLYDLLKEKDVKVIGTWKNEGYYFKKSKALIDDKTFAGLVLDENNQSEKSAVRIEKWLKQVDSEIKL